MKFRDISLVTISLLLVSVSFADEQIRPNIIIELDDRSDTGAIHLKLDSDEMGFDLHDMQEGETRSIVDESGRSVLITREADGFKLDVDGKIIDMPLFDQDYGMLLVNDIADIDTDVRVVGNTRLSSQFSTDGVTIISGTPIDAVTRDNIKSLLMSSGHSGDVNFIDHSATQGGDGLHEAIIIRKEVAVTH